jgi:PAS domain S-box-containing protein
MASPPSATRVQTRRSAHLLGQLILLVGAVAVPLLLLQGYNLDQNDRQARALAYRVVENQAAAVAHDLDSLLDDTQHYLSFLAQRPLIRASRESACDPLLEGVTQRRRHVANVFIADLQGRPTCYSVRGPGPLPQSLTAFDWYQRAAASDEMTLSKPFLAPVLLRMVSAMSEPLRASDGRRVGLLVVLLDLESIQSDWSRFSLPPDSRLTVFDGDGIVVTTRPDFEKLVGHDAGVAMRKAALDNPEQVGEAHGLDGIRRVFAFKPIAKASWRASATIPVAQVFLAQNAERERSYAAMAAVTAAVVVLAFFMARRIVAPLTSLVETARAIKTGHTDRRADEDVPGEFKEVAQEFNAMLDANRRHADFYKALSRTNGAIVRMPDERALFDEICRICVEHGHASIAYVSMIDGESMTPIASAGPAQAFIGDLALARVGRTGPSLSSTAARTGVRQIVNDADSDPRTEPWRTSGAAIGTRSIASLPFRRGGSCVGALTLHMTVPDFFDARVIALLDEMTEDISFALDNFDRAKANAAAQRMMLAESARFRTLFQTAPVLISIKTVADQRLLAVNQAYRDIVGKDVDTGATPNLRESGIWRGSRSHERFLSELDLRGRVRNFELQRDDHRGGVQEFLLQADIIEFDDQRCILTMGNEVSDLRRAERLASLREQQLAMLVDTAMDAIISVDSQYTIRVFNRAAAELFQVEPGAAIGSTIERFIPARLRSALRQHVENYARSGSTARRMGGSSTLVALRADGHEFPIEASISRMGEDGHTFTTVVIRDATQLQEAEKARLAQITAESASHAKTEFLSRMSHELRTPLNAVLGFSQLLQSDADHPLPPRQRMQVEQIRTAGWHLLALINDVLDMSKIEGGHVSVADEGVELQAALDEAVRIHRPAADAAGVSIVASRHDALPAVFVRADRLRLRQVLLNLLSNAIKYNRRDGSVELRVQAVDGRVHVDVIDTGLGMDADQLEHLYEPFNRLGRERQAIEGTGLGLALTRQLVELMGGAISVRSTAGEGTSVRLTLRADASPPATTTTERGGASGAEPPPPSLPRGVVLYIEDNAVNFMLVEQLMQRWPDVTLLHAETGQEGLDMALAHPTDLILLDMRLPDFDGVETLRRLQLHPLTRGRRVVALSASAMPEDVDAARRAGALDYWTKPLDFDVFLREMKTLLNTRQVDAAVDAVPT